MKAIQISAAALGIFAAMSISASAQTSTGRYTPPPAVQLSPDLASPWILQLSRKPARNGGYQVEVARPQPVRRNWQMRPAIGEQAREYRRFGTTPLQADPVRRTIRPQIVHRPQAVQQPQPVRQAAVNPKPAKRQEIDPIYEMQIVAYDGGHAPGTIVIDTTDRFLYLVGENGQARRYGVGVGKEGFEWSGTNKISRKAEWPDWRPPAQMIAREKKKGRTLPAHMPGGPENPLGARALYLGDTLYRIHGTNQPWTIGRAVSSGCIRMRNEDVIDLYERVRVGAKVVVS